MDPVYVSIMSLSICAGFLLSRMNQRDLPLNSRQRLGIAGGALCGGVIAAKLPFVLSDWEGFLSGAAWFDNGRTLTLGLVGGYMGVEFAKYALGVRVRTGDGFAFPVAVAIAIGRLGCFRAGCCYGNATELPWGVCFADDVVRHPTQIYEFMFHSGAAAVLLVLKSRALFQGQLMKLYILGYFAFRFFTESLRPEPELVAGLTFYQLIVLIFFPLFVLLWIRDGRQRSTEGRGGSSRT